MSDPSPTNGRVTIAVVATKVDSLTDIVLKTNSSVDNMRRELGEMRQVAAVNEERWRNHDAVQKAAIATHDKAQGEAAEAHEKRHQREHGVIGTVILIATSVSGTVSAWWGSR